MITKINKINNFGIYKGFKWNNELGEFRKKNLVYGWNYSGKTTLSKLFQTIEFHGKKQYFEDAEFSLVYSDTITNQEHIITIANIHEPPFRVKVFNSQYIKDVFISDNMDQDFQPISFYLGDESANLDKQIKELAKHNDILANRKEKIKTLHITEFELYDNKKASKFSDKAKEIRENYLDRHLNRDEFNVSHFRTRVTEVKQNPAGYILSDQERDRTKNEATTVKDFEPQKEDYDVPGGLQELATSVKDILENTAPKATSFPELDDNEELFTWTQSGLILHENESTCKFCTSPLPETRLESLNSYYSKKLQHIQVLIDSTMQKIKDEREKLKITFPDKKHLYLNYQTDYQTAIDNLNNYISKHLSQLKILETDLKRKSSSYFTSLTASPIQPVSLASPIEQINATVKKHNFWLEKFDENKANALNKLLNHYVADYLSSESYVAKESKHQKAVSIISRIDTLINSNNSTINKLETEIKSLVKGQEELNELLSILLHRDDIKIKIRNEKFTLDRGGYPASNLSEGEKSAIAFAYYLTELKSLRQHEPSKLPKTIIFIDDPISSLDSNHIFQVRSLIQDFFRDDDYAQIFISTHNFEFFSVMRDSDLFRNFKGAQKAIKRPFFWVRRKDDNTSTLEKLPKTFSEYKSEYVALFHLLNDYNNHPSKQDFQFAVMLPNAVRRFMELYTAMKYPSTQDSLDERARTVFDNGSKTPHTVKLLHWFSHQNQFEKAQQHDDKLLQIDEAIDNLLTYIRQEDELHWKGLNEKTV